MVLFGDIVVFTNFIVYFQLLSASTDNNVCIWEVLSGDCIHKYRFPSPVLKVQFHPRNDSRFLVCPMRYAAVLVDIEGEHKCLPLDPDVSFYVLKHFKCLMMARAFNNVFGCILCKILCSF